MQSQDIHRKVIEWPLWEYILDIVHKDSQRYSIDEKHPFLNRDLIELALNSQPTLKMKNGITRYMLRESVKDIIPSAGQGVISLQCRVNDNNVIPFLKNINHYETNQKVNAERGVLKVLEGDCHTAVGVHAVITGNEITLEAELFSLDGNQRFYEKKSSIIDKAQELGEEVGQILKKKSNNNYKK